MKFSFTHLTSPTLLLAGLLALVGCGGNNGDQGLADPDSFARLPDVTTADPAELSGLAAEIREYYETKINLPPDVWEAREAGRISQEAIDERTAAGEFQKFFTFATPEDIPADLTWEDGMDLPDLGSPEAVKGGTRYGALQDFPRTLRLVGPDSNNSFRGYILDDVQMSFAHRHPNVTEVDADGFHKFPGLAERWAIDQDNRTVYVKINPNARWSDGEPVTTEDVFFMFYFFHSPWIQAPWYNNWYNRSYDNVTRYDDLTFSITVPEAKPDMSSRVLGLRPVPAHFYGDFGPDYVTRYQWALEPTLSPYLITPDNFKKNQFIRFTRNDDWWAKDNKYWRNRYNVDAIQLRVIRETSKAFEAFRKGELDSFGMNLPEYYYERMPNDSDLVENGFIHKYTFYNEVPRPTFGLWINQSKSLLDNPDVRRGIQYASNWGKVIDQYFRGDYARMRTTADGYGVFTHPTMEARPFDVERALSAFERAGFTERDEDGILVNEEGERLSFTITSGYEEMGSILAILQEEALKAGLDFQIEVLDGTAAWKKIQEKNHDIAFSAFGVSPEMYPRYWETYHSINAYDQPFLPSGEVNPERVVKTQTNNLQSIALQELDKLIERYRASEDAEEMIELAHQMEEILYEDASFVPGFVMPFYRWANWRWVRWPEDLNVKISGGPSEYSLHWIEPGAREETMRALRAGETFEPVIKTVDKYSTYDAE